MDLNFCICIIIIVTAAAAAAIVIGKSKCISVLKLMRCLGGVLDFVIDACLWLLNVGVEKST
jgi:hypothetical protein